MVSFLKKPIKKKKHEMKLVSQSKMNLYFVGGLASIVLLSLLSITVSLVRASRSSDSQPKVIQSKKSDEVDYRLQAFLDGYISAYFNFNADEKLDEQNKALNGYYNFVPDSKTQSQRRVTTALISSKIIKIEKQMAVYRVTYETGMTEKQRVTVLFGIPYGGKDGQYFVAGLPHFQAVEDYKAKEVHSKGHLNLSAVDDVSEEDREKLTDFLNLFFKNYTTSQDNLNVISKNVQAINGVAFNSLDFTFFKIKKGEITAYAQVTFEIAGTPHSENFTLKIKQREDGFFVEEVGHTIPSDYAKK